MSIDCTDRGDGDGEEPSSARSPPREGSHAHSVSNARTDRSSATADETANATDARDPYRPGYHFAPSNGWMNDPNGLVYHDGVYHLFYQAGEDRRRWDHATSPDLLNWTEHGTKIPATGEYQAYSGGAVVDHENTAGFGEGALVCFFTGHFDDSGNQDQRLAYSTDGGRTLTKYDGNPIISSDVGDFRDPNVFWYEPTESWRMVVSRVDDHPENPDRPRGIEIYESETLTEWTYCSTYESGDDQWECPDLYELPVRNTSESRWVMSVSRDWDHHQYHIGRFDGSEFSVDDVVWADDGRDFYGAQSWTNEPSDDRRLMVAWTNHWEYAMETPDNGWKGIQSFPRQLELEDTGSKIVPIQSPDAALENARDGPIATVDDERIDRETDPLAGADVDGTRLELVTTIDPGDADAVTLTVSYGPDQRVTITYDIELEELFFDRADAGHFFGNTDMDVASGPLSVRSDGAISLRVLLDRSLIEIFGNDGTVAMTNQIFPDETSSEVSLAATGGTATLERFDAYRLTVDGLDD